MWPLLSFTDDILPFVDLAEIHLGTLPSQFLKKLWLSVATFPWQPAVDLILGVYNLSRDFSHSFITNTYVWIWWKFHHLQYYFSINCVQTDISMCWYLLVVDGSERSIQVWQPSQQLPHSVQHSLPTTAAPSFCHLWHSSQATLHLPGHAQDSTDICPGRGNGENSIDTLKSLSSKAS